ncbi:MAG: putative Ig domain-containing protein [Verrucomicrobia bacterium]|nr:putative Ig domain-containing protein [Verrucomicrobiota bacterium]
MRTPARSRARRPRSASRSNTSSPRRTARHRTSFGATGLPAGLTLTGAVISGIPNEASTQPIPITPTATNAAGTSHPKTLLLGIAAAPATPIITSALGAHGRVGSAFTYQITASEGATSFVALDLPAGLSVNATTGAISGTPVSSDVFSVTLRAANSAGVGAPSTLRFNVAPALAAPSITSTPAANGKVGVNFTYAIVATPGAITGYALTGTLPLGLSFNTSTGVISGRPSRESSQCNSRRLAPGARACHSRWCSTSCRPMACR